MGKWVLVFCFEGYLLLFFMGLINFLIKEVFDGYISEKGGDSLFRGYINFLE